MKYKVGDRVRIKSLEWYNENKDIHGDICFDNAVFVGGQSLYCGCELTIRFVAYDSYRVIENDYYWTDEMIDCLVEEETKPKFKVGDKVILDPYPCIVTDVHWRDSLHGFVYTVRGTDFGKIIKEDELVFDERPTPTTDEIVKNIKADWNNFKNRYNLPKDYHFVDKNGNEINISEIVLEKKKKEYPKTYEKCCNVLDIDAYDLVLSIDYRSNKMKHNDWKRLEKLNALNQILICRDAYWKIAGEEMGLDGPWEPDWDDDEWPDMYYISFSGKSLDKEKGYPCCNMVLIFPTEEMRDAFYENFKELIEICKELL